MFYYLPMQHIYITDYQWLFILIGTTSVFTSTQNVGNKCKSLYFIVLHIRVVPPSFSHFVECPLSDATCWTIEHFRMDVTERLLNAKVVVFLEFLCVTLGFIYSNIWFAWKSVTNYGWFIEKRVTCSNYSFKIRNLILWSEFYDKRWLWWARISFNIGSLLSCGKLLYLFCCKWVNITNSIYTILVFLVLNYILCGL